MSRDRSIFSADLMDLVNEALCTGSANKSPDTHHPKQTSETWPKRRENRSMILQDNHRLCYGQRSSTQSSLLYINFQCQPAHLRSALPLLLAPSADKQLANAPTFFFLDHNRATSHENLVPQPHAKMR